MSHLSFGIPVITRTAFPAKCFAQMCVCPKKCCGFLGNPVRASDPFKRRRSSSTHTLFSLLLLRSFPNLFCPLRRLLLLPCQVVRFGSSFQTTDFSVFWFFSGQEHLLLHRSISIIVTRKRPNCLAHFVSKHCLFIKLVVPFGKEISPKSHSLSSSFSASLFYSKHLLSLPNRTPSLFCLHSLLSTSGSAAFKCNTSFGLLQPITTATAAADSGGWTPFWFLFVALFRDFFLFLFLSFQNQILSVFIQWHFKVAGSFFSFISSKIKFRKTFVKKLFPVFFCIFCIFLSRMHKISSFYRLKPPMLLARIFFSLRYNSWPMNHSIDFQTPANMRTAFSVHYRTSIVCCIPSKTLLLPSGQFGSEGEGIFVDGRCLSNCVLGLPTNGSCIRQAVVSN